MSNVIAFALIAIKTIQMTAHSKARKHSGERNFADIIIINLGTHAEDVKTSQSHTYSL